MSITLATTTLLYYAKHNKCIQYSNAIILPLSHSWFGLLDIIMCYQFKCSEIIWRVRVVPDTKISIQYFYAYMRHNPGWHAICITSGNAVIASLVSYIMSHRNWMCIIIYPVHGANLTLIQPMWSAYPYAPTSLYGIHMPLLPYMVIQPTGLGMALLWAAIDSALSQWPLLWRHNDMTVIVSRYTRGRERDTRQRLDNANARRLQTVNR